MYASFSNDNRPPVFFVPQFPYTPKNLPGHSTLSMTPTVGPMVFAWPMLIMMG